MYKVLTLNKISEKGIRLLGKNYDCSENVENPNAILLRSAKIHDMEFGDNLVAIARAGAGTNNIPVDKCSDSGIVVFNTPGANANAVKELAITGLLLASRKIVQGIEWTKNLSGENIAKQIEKGKSSFAGPELLGKHIGIIGLGAIGSLVANTAAMLGMKVYGYDPYISIQSAWRLSSAIYHATSIDEIFSECDYISLHVPLNKDTENIINKDTILKMKDGVRVINFARGQLVNSEDVVSAAKSGKISCYVTDFPTEEMLNVENIISMPHLGASTPEAEDNCAIMACDELGNYIENGNIINSVNMPNVVMPRSGEIRVCVLHKNIPNMISGVSTVLCNNGANIENMQSKSRGNYAYSIIDITGDFDEKESEQISKIDGVIKIRIIK